MLNEEYIEKLVEESGEIAKNLHDRLIREVLKRFIIRVMRTGKVTFSGTDKYQLNVLQEAGYTLTQLQKEIAKATRLQIPTIRKAMKQAGIESLKQDDIIYQMSGISGTSPWSAEYTRITASNYERTMGLWYNYTQTTADSGSQWFIDMCDRILPLVQTGSMSYTEAIINGINSLSTTGLEVTYPSGHHDSIEVATLRAVRTAVAQTAGQVTAQRANEMGVHLFLTSAHMGARPTHAIWQGKIFYVDWARLASVIPIQYEPVEDDYELKAKYPDFVSSTQIGTVTGLHGVNCRHSYTPYFEGISYNPYEQIGKKENAEAYENSQKARYMERSIRRDKRKLSSLEDALALDPQNERLQKEQSKIIGRLKNKTSQYYAFCRENDIASSEVRLKI